MLSGATSLSGSSPFDRQLGFCEKPRTISAMIAEPKTNPSPLDEALSRSNGARFYRCALQVNPYKYLVDNAKPDPWGSEDRYNRAIVDACHEYGIEVIAVTDHHRVSESRTLLTLAEEEKIAAFPGFEAESKEGIHFLCLFERGSNLELIDSYLAQCGVHQRGQGGPCKYDVADLLEHVEQCHGIAIAAHVLWKKGLLVALSGTACANVWKTERLVAAGIPGNISEAQLNYRRILDNSDAAYLRTRPMTLVNCNDVDAPEDLQKSSTTTKIKMSFVSLEGLRQAFLDPKSRIRLNSEPLPQERTEIVALAWEGGFLDGLRIHFNPDLNVFIGGRGTGKSTIIESLRYVLAVKALGEDAQNTHEKIIRGVVRSGTKISLLVESHRPDRRRYTVERTYPNAPIVRDENGEIVSIRPAELVEGIEIFGQHEITEVTRNATALTELLVRFADKDPSLQSERQALTRRLEESGAAILRSEREYRSLSERLSSLPVVRETLKRYQQAGVEERLRDQSLIVREEQVFRIFEERILRLEEALKQLAEVAPVDANFLSDGALQELPAREQLEALRPIVATMDQDLQKALQAIESAIAKARTDARALYAVWLQRKSAVQKEYETILRELHKSKIDGEEFIRLRRQIEELTPLAAAEEKLISLRRRQEAEREKLIADWEDLSGREYRRLDKAAREVSKRLGGRLRVSVNFLGNHEALLVHLRRLGFRTPETPVRRDGTQFSLRHFAESVRMSADEISKRYRYSALQAEKLAAAGLEWQLQLEETILPPTTDIELNVGSGSHDEWRALNDLSTGQKATAVLLLLLIDSDAPLIVDQPEDDLDNRFISESVVPRIRDAKGIRQFIFATHNANIPVLGDAELIAGLNAIGEASGAGRAVLDERYVGSIDKPEVAMFSEEILEGGKTAFVTRKEKYGF
jgi:hypothetical protein